MAAAHWYWLSTAQYAGRAKPNGVEVLWNPVNRQVKPAGGRGWDDETARTLHIVAFRSVETDTQLFHC